MQQSQVLLDPLARLLHQPGATLLVVLLVTAAVMDWRTYRIPNWLTAGGMALGLIYNTVTFQPWHEGLLGSLAGLGVGLVVLLPVYALRVMGAGDVKLMAMVGAFVGLPDIFNAVLYSLIVGGIAAVGFRSLPQGFAPHDSQRHGHRAVHGIRSRRRRPAHARPLRTRFDRQAALRGQHRRRNHRLARRQVVRSCMSQPIFSTEY